MSKKRIFITGAGSGFGAAIARTAAERGWELGLLVRDEGRFRRDFAEMTGENVRVYTADVRDEAALKAAIDAFARAAGGIDYLINSAGLALGLGAFAELAAADADEMVDTNIKGTLNACRAAISHIPHGGAIVNFGSIAGQYPYPGGHVYCGTKAFVQQFSEALRCDFAATGVRVSVIAPGLAKTNFSRTRFKGDEARAQAVYAHTNYLSAADVAAATFAVLDLPPHVNVTYFELMPQTQTPAALNTAPASFETEFSGAPQGSPDASEIHSRAEELVATHAPQTAATPHGAAK